MIQVGTKLRSTRSGKVVEVIRLESGAKRVKLEDGTVKVLNDANIARWYDEVKVSKDDNPEVVLGSKCAEKEKTLEKEVISPAENEFPLVMVGKKQDDVTKTLVADFFKFIRDNKISVSGKKVYNKAEFKGRGLFHFFLQNHCVRFEFKEKGLLDSEKSLMVKMPVHYRRSYNYILKAKDKHQICSAFKVVERIIKEIK